MKPTWSFTAAFTAILLTSCSASDPESQGPNAVEWKQVSRNVSGNVVTYNVPVERQVRSLSPDRPLPTYDPEKKKAPVVAAANTDTVTAQSKPSDGGQTLPSRYAVGEGTPSAAVTAPPSSITLDAETALGQAEITVRDAQIRFETAQAALSRAREAARNGDSPSVIKFSKTAQALAHPGP
jgi:hypothetical protein